MIRAECVVHVCEYRLVTATMRHHRRLPTSSIVTTPLPRERKQSFFVTVNYIVFHLLFCKLPPEPKNFCENRRMLFWVVIVTDTNKHDWWLSRQTRSQAVARIADRTARLHLSGWRDIIGHVTIWYPIWHFLLGVVLWNQASISNGLPRYSMANVTQWLTWP